MLRKLCTRKLIRTTIPNKHFGKRNIKPVSIFFKPMARNNISHLGTVAFSSQFHTFTYPAAAKKKREKTMKGVLLANEWDDNEDATGWWMSEKMDGIRGYWNGMKLYSRQKKEISAPEWYVKDFPVDITFDGELWHPDGFDRIAAISRSKDESVWQDVVYWVFDSPSHTGTFEERFEYLKTLPKPKQIQTVNFIQCKSKEHLKEFFDGVVKKGGEGIMLRKAGSVYEIGRSPTLFKMKAWYDSESKYVGLNDSSKGLICEMPNEEKFVVRCSWVDFTNPPPVGTVLTVKHNGLWKSGKPKYPYFFRIRRDLTWDDVVEQWKKDEEIRKAQELKEKEAAAVSSTAT